MRLKVNEKAPDFELIDDGGSTVALSDFHGMWVLLFFYPEDDSSGCTKEVQVLRDAHIELQKKDVVVLGVSTDSEESHKIFKSKHKLPFILLADEEGEVTDLYGVLNKDLGRARRVSFLVDSDGIIKKIYDDIEPDDQVDYILRDLNELQTL